MRLKRNLWITFWIVLIFLSIAAYSAKIMYGMSSIFNEFQVPNYLNRLALLFYFVLVAYFVLYHKYDRSLLGFGTIQFLAVFFFFDLFSQDGIIEAFMNAGVLLLSILTYLVGYNIYLKCFRDSVVLQYAVIAITLALCVEYFFLANGLRVTFGHSYLRLGIAYVPLIFSPLLLLKTNKFNWLCFIILAYVLVDSGKRGGLLALLTGLILYYGYVRGAMYRTKKVRTFFMIAVVLLAGVGVLSDIGALDRLLYHSNDSDFSSGRLEIYSDLLSKFWYSGFFSMMFGHGLGSTADYSQSGMTAHNDFVEALFDFGLIGFTSYLIFYYCFLRQIHKISKENMEIKAVYIYSFILVLCMSFVSQIFIYQYLCLFTFMLGALSGAYKKIQNEQR